MNPSIILLPPDLSSKIAAGEVIERPASVVKELVENSLDAGAAEIRVELRSGGRNLVRVEDNGAGMNRHDAALCFERHATSKIAGEEDLSRISTLGFRGEALAAISAVSRLVLKTSAGEGAMGTIVEREGGKELRVEDAAFPRGTSIEVRDLFFNLPARRKFLRSDQSELGAVTGYLTSAALAYPEVGFSLVHGSRKILQCPRVESLKERIFQLFGKSTLESLMEVDFGDENFRLYGFSSRPPSGRANKSRQHFFINRRPVRDRILQASLNQAYAGFQEKERFAECFLFLTLPFEEVDVNVHPAKAEVRFKDNAAVFRLVLRGVEQAMLKDGGIKELKPAYPPEWTARPGPAVAETGWPRGLSFPAADSVTAGPGAMPAVSGREEASSLVLGQYLDTYIVAVKDRDLLVIDQHNAHERVLFEKYGEVGRTGKMPRRLALIPPLLELSPSQVLVLEENRGVLEEAGFVAEEMGGRSYALKEFPDIFKEAEAGEVFLSLLDEVREEKGGDWKDRLLAALACKTAVKAGERLAREKMEYLVEELFKTPHFSVCPHGRPVLVKIEKSHIEKTLKR